MCPEISIVGRSEAEENLTLELLLDVYASLQESYGRLKQGSFEEEDVVAYAWDLVKAEQILERYEGNSWLDIERREHFGQLRELKNESINDVLGYHGNKLVEKKDLEEYLSEF